MAPIGVGSTLPDGQLAWFDESDQLQQVSIHSLAAGKKVILFGVPGAFTPTCRSISLLPHSYFYILSSLGWSIDREKTK
jgi:peroxiredoxin